jgi:hypothetical protein
MDVWLHAIDEQSESALISTSRLLYEGVDGQRFRVERGGIATRY